MALLVNGELVADRLFAEELQRLGAMPADLAQMEAERRVLERVVLRQMAVSAGITVSEAETEAERRRRWGSTENSICGAGISAQIRGDLLARKMVEHLSRHVPRPSRQDVEAFYRTNLGMFQRPERVQVSHIIRNVESPSQEAEAREAIDAAMQDLERGRQFAKVAEQYSDCKDTGGSIGWIARGEMVAGFDDVVFALPIGKRSDIFRTVFGWHIAVVTAKKPAGVEPLELVRAELTKGLYEGRKERAVSEAVNAVLQQASIVQVPGTDRGPVLGEELPR